MGSGFFFLIPLIFMKKIQCLKSVSRGFSAITRLENVPAHSNNYNRAPFTDSVSGVFEGGREGGGRGGGFEG